MKFIRQVKKLALSRLLLLIAGIAFLAVPGSASASHGVRTDIVTTFPQIGPGAEQLCNEIVASFSLTESRICSSGTNINTGVVNWHMFTATEPPESPDPDAWYTVTVYIVNEKRQGKICVGKPESVANSTTVGNPIFPSDGAKIQTEIDYRGPGIFPLMISRTYTSKTIFDGQHSTKNWDFDFSGSYTLDPLQGPGRIVVRYPDSSSVFFTDDGFGNWSSDADVVIQVEEIHSGGNQTGWQVVTDTDRIQTHDLDGVLTEITYRGHKHTYSYSGVETTITDNYGKTLTVTRDASDRVIKVVGPSSGVQFDYVYVRDNYGPITDTVTYPDATTRIYTYGQCINAYQPNIEELTDELGVVYAKWDHNCSDEAILSEHAGGVEKVELDHNYGTDQTKVTNSLAKETVFHFETVLDVKRVKKIEVLASLDPSPQDHATATTDITYDTNGFVDIVTKPEGDQIDYDYNSRGLEISRTEGVGTPQARTITTEWHPDFRLPTKITEPELETTIIYDTNGNLDTVTRKDRVTNELRVADWDYNTLGQLTQFNGPRPAVSGDDVTTHSYYTCTSGLGKCGQKKKITNALGQITKFDVDEYNDHGQPRLIIDPNGVETKLTYDARMRLVSIEVDGQYLTQIGRDPAGQITRITTPNGSYLDYEYDGAHRLEAIVDALGNRIELDLDSEGNIETVDIKDTSLTIQKTQSAVYDKLSRLRFQNGANSQSIEYKYDTNDNNDTLIDGMKSSVIKEFDSLDRLFQVTDAKSGITKYGYDDHDRIVTVEDPNGLITTYTYNGFGDLASTDSPDTGTTTFLHDKAGNVTKRTDARGKVVDYAYDYLNRKISDTYPTDSNLDTVYTYDETAYNNYGIGRLTSVLDISGTTSYFYDSRGLINMIDRVIGTDVYRVDYDYDASGLLTGIVYPSGRRVTYSRDSANRIDQVSVTKDEITTVLASNFSYKPFGPVTDLTLGNSIVRSIAYDTDYRVTSIADGTVLDRTYLTNVYDNIYDITDGVDNIKSQDFTYDDLDRLIDASGVYGDIDYGTYDGTGNRQTLSVDNGTDNVYAYTPNTQHLASITGPDSQAFTYDGAGNVITRNSTTQVYDDRGRLKQSTTGGVTTTYVYNFAGERVQKITPTATTHYVYDESRLLFEYDGTSGKEYAYLHGQPLAAWHGISPATLGQSSRWR